MLIDRSKPVSNQFMQQIVFISVSHISQDVCKSLKKHQGKEVSTSAILQPESLAHVRTEWQELQKEL